MSERSNHIRSHQIIIVFDSYRIREVVHDFEGDWLIGLVTQQDIIATADSHAKEK